MAILSDYEEEPQPQQQQQSQNVKNFSSTLDPSNPLGFLQSAFEFVAAESDFFSKDSSEKEVVNLVKKLREKRQREELEKKKKKEQEAAASASPSASASASKEVDPAPMEEDKDEKEKSKYRGFVILCFLCSYLTLGFVFLEFMICVVDDRVATLLNFLVIAGRLFNLHLVILVYELILLVKPVVCGSIDTYCVFFN